MKHLKFIEPMLLDTRTDPFDSNDYLFEPKSNGVRIELLSDESGIKLITRHGNDITLSLPEIKSLHVEQGITLDGELVCYDLENPLKEDFEAVMTRIMSKRHSSIASAAIARPCTLIVFDILTHKYKSVMRLPLSIRKGILESSVENQQRLTKVIHVLETGKTLFELIKQYELEGMVAKRLDSTYKAGRRPKDLWCKIINWQYSECVVTGYRKESTALYLSISTDDGFKYVGTVEFGLSTTQKKSFYKVASKIITGETKGSIWIQPLIRCTIKHRGYLKSGNIMTPVFVDFIDQL